MKPDIAAPGVDITAARSQEMTDGGDRAVPHAQRHLDGHARTWPARRRSWPSSTPSGPAQQLKEQLMSSAKGLDAATRRSRSAPAGSTSPRRSRNTVRGTGSLFFGNYTWPHDPSRRAVTKDLTFTNAGAQDVTLDLALTGDGGAVHARRRPPSPCRRGGNATVPVTGDPQAADVGTARRLDRRHRRGHRQAGDPDLRRPDQGGRALRPDHQAGRPQTATPRPAG